MRGKYCRRAGRAAATSLRRRDDRQTQHQQRHSPPAAALNVHRHCPDDVSALEITHRIADTGKSASCTRASTVCVRLSKC